MVSSTITLNMVLLYVCLLIYKLSLHVDGLLALYKTSGIKYKNTMNPSRTEFLPNQNRRVHKKLVAKTHIRILVHYRDQSGDDVWGKNRITLGVTSNTEVNLQSFLILKNMLREVTISLKK